MVYEESRNEVPLLSITFIHNTGRILEVDKIKPYILKN